MSDFKSAECETDLKFLEGLMFESAFRTSEICVTKAIGLVYFWKEVNEVVLNTLSYRDQRET